MAEVTQYLFSHREIVETLIKKQDLHEGIWTISFQLGMGTANVVPPAGGDPVPGVIVSVLGVGLQRAEKETPNGIDAAKINPKK